MDGDSDGLTDKGKLLFGAGFVFGVMVTMVILAVVVAAVGSRGTTIVTAGEPLVVTAVAGAIFAAIVGVGLYYLAFPEHRTAVSVDGDQFGYIGDDAEEPDEK